MIMQPATMIGYLGAGYNKMTRLKQVSLSHKQN